MENVFTAEERRSLLEWLRANLEQDPWLLPDDQIVSVKWAGRDGVLLTLESGRTFGLALSFARRRAR
jgi:hypothetical protein